MIQFLRDNDTIPLGKWNKSLRTNVHLPFYRTWGPRLLQDQSFLCSHRGGTAYRIPHARCPLGHIKFFIPFFTLIKKWWIVFMAENSTKIFVDKISRSMRLLTKKIFRVFSKQFYSVGEIIVSRDEEMDYTLPRNRIFLPLQIRKNSKIFRKILSLYEKSAKFRLAAKYKIIFRGSLIWNL